MNKITIESSTIYYKKIETLKTIYFQFFFNRVEKLKTLEFGKQTAANQEKLQSGIQTQLIKSLKLNFSLPVTKDGIVIC